VGPKGGAERGVAALHAAQVLHARSMAGGWLPIAGGIFDVAVRAVR